MPAHFVRAIQRHIPASSKTRLRRRALCSCLFLIVAVTIACAGTIFSAFASSVPEMRIVRDLRPVFPTVILRGIENGELVGDIKGDLRLFLGDQLIIPNGSGAFRVPAGILQTDIRTIAVPAGMRFVASTKGKRYYSVDAAQARNLAPKNRVYFRNEEEAKAAGYR